jgi:hypothetical protein
LGSGKNNSTTNKCVFFFGSLSVVDGVHRMATEKFSKSAKLQALMIQLSRWLFERKNHGSTKEYAFEEQTKGWKQVQQVILVKVRPRTEVISRPNLTNLLSQKGG